MVSKEFGLLFAFPFRTVEEMKPFVTLEKEVGQTPLVCAENWRAAHPEYADAPLAYAGRLDPMASGKLLILIGEECKQQKTYHGLDKRYEFSVLLGVSSDTGDVLGRLFAAATVPETSAERLYSVANSLTGEITLPYPHFSSKTVQGKALHTWTLENRLSEIEIPAVTSTLYDCVFESIETMTRSEVTEKALTKIETIPPVTETSKAIGNDFRRVDVRADWKNIQQSDILPDTYQIARFACIASSGTYMRSLAEVIAKQVGTTGLAWHIHRTHVGVYDQSNKNWATLY